MVITVKRLTLLHVLFILLLSTIVGLLGACDPFNQAQPPDDLGQNNEMGQLNGRGLNNEQGFNNEGTRGLNDEPIGLLGIPEGEMSPQGGFHALNDSPQTLTGELEQRVLLINQEDEIEVDTLTDGNQVFYPVVDVFESLGYEVVADETGHLKAGYTDVLYEVQVGSDVAVVEEEERVLASEVVSYGDNVYMGVRSFEVLLAPTHNVSFHDETLFITDDDNDIIFPIQEDFTEPEDEAMEGEASSFLNKNIMHQRETNETVAVMNTTIGQNIVNTAQQFVGTPFQFGADPTDTSAFDSSSFTQYVYAVNGIALPRSTRSQARMGRYIPHSLSEPGDLVFFSGPNEESSFRTVGHVGIYIGDGHIVHATPEQGVHVINLRSNNEWTKHFLGVKRVG